MLEKKTEEQITVLPDGQLQVKTITIILEDGVEQSRQNHRHVVDVGDDVTNEASLVREIAEKIHTPERVQARKNARNNQ